jgi:hypothetical protein
MKLGHDRDSERCRNWIPRTLFGRIWEVLKPLPFARPTHFGREQALEIAFSAESAGLEYYRTIFETTADPEIKILAKQFVEEEKGHVTALQKTIALIKQ